MMKRLVLTVGLWVLTACAAGPGFEAGHAAYERGDFKTAFEILLPLAQAGDSRSMWLLGDIHGDSAGESADLVKAEAYYLQSARAGNLVGMNKLAQFYRMKAEKPRQALKWWLALFREGVFEAAYSIGYLYRDGLLGGQPEEVEALAWFRIGLEQGVEGLKPLVNTLERELGPDALARAEKRKRAIEADLGL